MNEEKKSITLRLEEPDICEWLAAQSSGVSSVKTAIKIAIFQYGKDRDLLDAILEDKFGPNGSRPKTNQVQAPAVEATTPAAQVSRQTEAPVAPAPQPVQAPAPVQSNNNGMSDALASLL